MCVMYVFVNVWQSEHGGDGDNLCVLENMSIDLGAFSDEPVTKKVHFFFFFLIVSSWACDQAGFFFVFFLMRLWPSRCTC